MHPFRWGIIGPGSIAHDFVKDLAYVTSGPQQITAVYSHNIEGAKEFAEQYNVPAWFVDAEKFIANGNMDAVYIATPHTFHHEHTLLCLNNKIPVLCEKPLAINAEQVKEMIAAAEKNKTFLMEGMWVRFLPSIKKVMEIIHHDVIGNVLSVKADMSYKAPYDPESRYFNPELGGGSLLDLGIYPVYLSLLLLGKPKEIKAIAKLSDKGIDESCALLFQYAQGQHAILESSLITQTELVATIHGEKGNIKILSPWNEKPSAIEVVMLKDGTERHELQWEGRGFQFETDEVVQCIRRNVITSHLFSHEMSIDLMETMDEIRSAIHLYYETEPYEESIKANS